MKNKLVWHEIILFAAALIFIGWKMLVGRTVFDLSLLWWLLGICLGFLFIFMDRVIYSFYTHKEEALSMKIRDLVIKKHFAEAVSFLVNERQEQRELVMRSFLFVGLWVVLSVFALTSSINTFARGFMLGMGTHLIFDLTTDFLWNKPRFDLWFWQIKRKVGDDEKMWFYGLSVLVYIFLASGL